MTTAAGHDAVEVRYEGPAPTFGGFDSADFAIHRPHQRSLEVNLRLGLDARAVFEAKAGPLSDAAVQALLRALAQRIYPAAAARGAIPAILTLRARDIAEDEVDAILAEASPA